MNKKMCIPIIIDNRLKAYFFNKKYIITIKTRLKQIVIEKLMFNKLITVFVSL